MFDNPPQITVWASYTTYTCALGIVALMETQMLVSTPCVSTLLPFKAVFKGNTKLYSKDMHHCTPYIGGLHSVHCEIRRDLSMKRGRIL